MEIEAIMKEQRAFFDSGKTLDIEYRLSALEKFRQTILAREEEIYCFPVLH